jgi:hypothetical protein
MRVANFLKNFGTFFYTGKKGRQKIEIRFPKEFKTLHIPEVSEIVLKT